MSALMPGPSYVSAVILFGDGQAHAKPALAAETLCGLDLSGHHLSAVRSVLPVSCPDCLRYLPEEIR